jgi:hypothetical protein
VHDHRRHVHYQSAPTPHLVSPLGGGSEYMPDLVDPGDITAALKASQGPTTNPAPSPSPDIVYSQHTDKGPGTPKGESAFGSVPYDSAIFRVTGPLRIRLRPARPTPSQPPPACTPLPWWANSR